MDCVNHTGVNATAYCQSCGKALCATCVRNAPGGQILCEPCWTSWLMSATRPRSFGAMRANALDALSRLEIRRGLSAKVYNGALVPVDVLRQRATFRL